MSTYFTDSKVSKTCKIGITNLLSNITTKDHSHKGGWTKLLKCQLINEGYENIKILNNKDNVQDFDCIIFDLGAEFSGGLNLFGGLDEKCYIRVQGLLEASRNGTKFFSWKHLVPDLASTIMSRKSNNSTYDKFKQYTEDQADEVIDFLNTICTFQHVAPKTHILFGDSHTPSVWDPSMLIERQDGRTLFGTIKNDTLQETITLYNESGLSFDEITVYIGNIDIRHHIMRQEKPWEAIQDLCLNYEKMLQPFAQCCKINIIGALPIENESRKLPKTGYYKSTPFMGEWKERAALVEIFNKLMQLKCLNNGWQFHGFPNEFKNEIGELTFDVMERPQSIHLSPKYYKWDLDENKRRW